MKYTVVAFLVLVLFGCAGDEQDRQAIRTVMLQRQQALRSKDLNGYLALISQNYASKGQDFAAKKQELATNFASFDAIDYRSNGYEVVIAGDDATVSGDYALKVVIGAKAVKLEGKEEIRLHKELQGWRIVSGL